MIQALCVLLALGLAVAPWTAVAARRFGGRIAVTGVGAATAVVLLWIGVLAHLTRVPLAALVIAAALVAAASGGIVARREFRVRIPVVGHSRAGEWIASSVGGLVWIAVIVAAGSVPGAAQVGWVLAGDSFNNVDLARQLAEAGGIRAGNAWNPVPLPAMLLVVLGGGQASVGHDIDVIAVLWSAGIVASSLLAGLVACSLIDPARTRIRAVVAGTASLLPLTVLMGTLPMFWGFLNAAVVAPVLLASWVLTLEAARRPAASVVGNLLLTTVALAGWAPLAAVPAVVAVATAVRFRARLRELTGGAAIVAAVALAQAGLWAVLFSVAPLIGSTLTFAIETIGFPSMWPALLGTAAAIAACVLVGYRSDRGIRWSVAVWGGGVAVTTLGMVVLARGDLVAYYPAKMAWFLLVDLLVVLVALLGGLASGAPMRALAVVPAAVAVVVAAAVPTSAPGAPPLRPAPLVPFTGGLWWGGGETERLVKLTTREGSPALLWRSGFADEGIVDYWALLAGGGYLGGDAGLRELAFDAYQAARSGERWQGGSAASLCDPLRLIDGLVIFTADPSLESEIEVRCQVGDAPVRLISGTDDIV